MTDTKTAVAVVKPPLASGNRVAAIVPDNFESVYRLAQVIHASGMAPQSYKSVEQITVAIMHGMEVGFTPMAALQSIAVINGMPTIWGDGMLALVRASGIVVDLEETVERDNNGAVISATCRLNRAGQKTPIIRTFSRADAQKAGLWDKAGPWKQYPQRMMQMRARSWCLRDGGADILRGLSSAEEAMDAAPRDITPRAAEPTRDQFMPPTQPAVTDVHDDGGSTGDESEGWPLYDALGETVGTYGVTEWLGELDGLMAGLPPKARAQMTENNRPSADAILGDADVPESLMAQIADRFQTQGAGK